MTVRAFSAVNLDRCQMWFDSSVCKGRQNAKLTAAMNASISPVLSEHCKDDSFVFTLPTFPSRQGLPALWWTQLSARPSQCSLSWSKFTGRIYLALTSLTVFLPPHVFAHVRVASFVPVRYW